MKYVIEIEDKPLCYYDKESNIYFPRVRKAIGFKTLVFDEEGLKRLEPYEEVDAEEVYRKGLEDMHEAIKKIANMSAEDKDAVFDTLTLYYIVNNYTANEIMKKLATYEQQKADEIKVGDEVTYTFEDGTEIEPFVVFKINNDGGNRIYEGHQVTDGRWVGGGLDYKKTGRHFPEVARLLEKMKGSVE